MLLFPQKKKQHQVNRVQKLFSSEFLCFFAENFHHSPGECAEGRDFLNRGKFSALCVGISQFRNYLYSQTIL